MHTGENRSEFEGGPLIQLDAIARRSLVTLCAVYFVLGVIHAGWFVAGPFATFREDAAVAAAKYEKVAVDSDWTQAAEDDARDQETNLGARVTSLEEELSRLQKRAEELTMADDLAAATARRTAASAEGSLLEARELLSEARREATRLRQEGVLLGASRNAMLETRNSVLRGWVRLGAFLGGAALLIYFVGVQQRRVTSRQGVVAAATMMIVLLGVMLLASRLVLQKVVPDLSAWGLADLFALHLLACLILPWTPRESALPFGLLLLVWTVTFLVPRQSDFEILDRLVAAIVSPVILAPGALIAGWRWRRLQEDAERLLLGEQVRSMGGELSRARIVHDAMFPDPFDTGHVRFEYDYRPIQEIGGDYVHLSLCRGSGRIYLTVLDVAGHGLAAALTVNRLFGELERIRAEDPDAEPGLVMELLNRYINLTMATHSLYATGCCLMLDPHNGDLKWVNAGHPPALVRKHDGRVIDLGGTTILLGAEDHSNFHANQQATTIEPGDVLIAYTDGAFEARDREGRRFGLENVRRTASFAPPPRDWSKFISNAVAEHHGGHAEDDVLVATLHLRSLCLGELLGNVETFETRDTLKRRKIETSKLG